MHDLMDLSSSHLHHHHQEMSQLPNTNPQSCSGDEKKARPQPEQALKCPRCDSTNTKFCYYNNYSLTQPRYFCKSCRRYWTKGGTLRNVPVGGGCRKSTKRSSSSSSSSCRPRSMTDSQISIPPMIGNPLTSFLSSSYDSNDLSLAFAKLQKQHHYHQQQLGFDDDVAAAGCANTNSTTAPGFLEALRSSFVHTPNGNFTYYGGGGGGEQGYNGNTNNSNSNGIMNFQSTGDDVSGGLKEEYLSGGCGRGEDEEGSGKGMLWGFPWQMNNTNYGGNHQYGSNISDSQININYNNEAVVAAAASLKSSTEGSGWWNNNGNAGGGGGGGGAGNWHGGTGGLLNTTPLM